jgi:hypothetical protein
MKKILLIIVSICAIFTACKIDEPGKDLHRVVFDPGNLKFISTSLNTAKETSSALYGNQEALESLTNENHQPRPDSEFKLVTWKYHENPQYIGGTITGELLSIEIITTDKNGNISYTVRNSSENEKIKANKKDRIKYIMSYKPVVRP